jgi:hypothetical protein
MTATQPTIHQATIEVRNPADGSVVASGLMRATAAHGLRRIGIKPRGGAR